MTDYLWSKGDTDSAGPDAAVQTFLAGADIGWDRYLFAFDIQATRAHVAGLARIGILDQDEQGSLDGALEILARSFAEGSFELALPHEDGHSAIEAYLTEQLGDIGGKVHTGRSRNDQVQVALRLYMRDRLDQLTATTKDIAGALLDRAQRDGDAVMPGYTHLQRAVPSTLGLWLAGLAEAFIDIAQLSSLTRGWLNTSPLGTAAGYGVNLPLDRQGVAKALGFERQQINPQYAQNSRGRFELQALAALAQATLELRRLAWDLSLFTSSEFGFVKLSPRYLTGSSIMPNKNNPDTVELLRAQHAVVQGALAELQAALSLPSGYHRDLQVTKPPLIRAFESSLQALALIPDMVATLEFNLDAMRKAIDPELHATDVAIEQAIAGAAFRDAYRTVKAADLALRSPESSVAARVSPGACADLCLEALRQRLDSL
jgi:argininosuccinate lyase